MATPSSTRLLVLGIVRMLQPVHGYDVRRELLSWRADRWANVAPGSIYQALKTLERDQWIELVDSGQRGSRPARRTYRLTDEGEKEYHALLRSSLWESNAPAHPLLPAISQLPFSNRDDVIAALKARAHRLEAEIMMTRRDIERVEAGGGDPLKEEPHHVAEMMRLQLGLAEAEYAWALMLTQRIESGDLDVWNLPSRAQESLAAQQAEYATAHRTPVTSIERGGPADDPGDGPDDAPLG
ncbi:PadR family transcriptional regulator [Phytoactinopolyspora halotolerans]|uniref:PadR family transcriptional regulator n=1 Tax=Phytoactinopolyspora halotolerans TaxID=1981512 RepID=A0A6L9S769_9ACTN|nr:PadR family transcriptional regulator [Phytoactinopolyspora halotolerans]NEE00504.1 PadR family transcriptional regulator [Phytoactinopolyspora halotolerans]